MFANQAAYTVIDFETTGMVEGFPNVPWQVGMVYFAGGTMQADHVFQSLLNVGRRPFNPYAPGRHAQLRNEILSAPTLHDLWPTLDGWLSGRLIVAHNAATEKKCLGEAFPMHTFGPWVDTLSLARIAYPALSSHQLGDLVDALGLRGRLTTVCQGLAPHDAFYDACASALLLEHLLHLPGWDDLRVEDLVQARPSRYHRLKRTS